ELVFLGRDLGEQRNYSEEIAAVIDEEIRAIINHGYQTAKGILTAQRLKMDAVVEQLKIVETLDGKQLDEILARESPPAAAASSRRGSRARSVRFIPCSRSPLRVDPRPFGASRSQSTPARRP